MWSAHYSMEVRTVLMVLLCILDYAHANNDMDTDFLEEVENIKSVIRSQTKPSAVRDLSSLNITLEAKRQLVRLYRDQVKRLNDIDTASTIRPSELEYYTAPVLISSDKTNNYKILLKSLGIKQPEQYTKELKVESATLWLDRAKLNITSPRTMDSRNVGLNNVLLVHQLLPDNMRRLVSSKVISLANSGRLSLDVTQIVQSWFDEPAMNYGIEIDTVGVNVTDILRFNSDSLPQIDISFYTQDIITHRNKRSLPEPVCKPGACCRRPVEIKYADVGLHSEGIHAEGASFTAYICSGKCRKNYKLHNNWSNIKNHLWKKFKSKQFRNKCVATAFDDSFKVDHFDADGGITFTRYTNVIVKECGCM